VAVRETLHGRERGGSELEGGRFGAFLKAQKELRELTVKRKKKSTRNERRKVRRRKMTMNRAGPIKKKQQQQPVKSTKKIEGPATEKIINS